MILTSMRSSKHFISKPCTFFKGALIFQRSLNSTAIPYTSHFEGKVTQFSLKMDLISALLYQKCKFSQGRMLDIWYGSLKIIFTCKHSEISKLQMYFPKDIKKTYGKKKKKFRNEQENSVPCQETVARNFLYHLRTHQQLELCPSICYAQHNSQLFYA